MAIKFRKKIKIAPGIKINVTSKGVSSVSIGGKGATLNVGGKNGAKLTTSISGTGISHTQSLSSPNKIQASEANNSPKKPAINGYVIVALIAVVILAVLFS